MWLFHKNLFNTDKNKYLDNRINFCFTGVCISVVLLSLGIRRIRTRDTFKLKNLKSIQKMVLMS